MDSDSGSAVGVIFAVLVALVLFLGIHFFMALCLKKILEKCGREPGGLIWVPILQFIPMFALIGWENWKIVLFFIPFVNIVMLIWFLVVFWLEVMKQMSKPAWYLVFFFVPCGGILFPAYLAFMA